jgi:hypothetical protein
MERTCLFYDSHNRYGDFARYWSIDGYLYGFDYMGKLYICTKTEAPQIYKDKVPFVPGWQCWGWLRYSDAVACTDLMLCIFEKPTGVVVEKKVHPHTVETF